MHAVQNSTQQIKSRVYMQHVSYFFSFEGGGGVLYVLNLKYLGGNLVKIFVDRKFFSNNLLIKCFSFRQL
jgi:hypothetical protein